MFTSATVLPTGDEIKSGIVLDTDSPEVVRLLVAKYPEICVTRRAPVRDEQNTIEEEIRRAAGSSDLIVLIGGSGGGHRFSATLGKDFTHSALEEILDDAVSHALYGKNGHMWCKLVCGHMGSALVINLPGPFVEAQAAMKAFCDVADAALPEGGVPDLARINTAMTEAVRAQYPV